MTYLGELAALLTAVCWTFTSTFFTLAGRRVGSVIVNRTRLLAAFGLMLLIHKIAMGTWFPSFDEPGRWFWMGFSGLVGFTLGDASLFQAFVMIGPRLAMLLMSLAPALATLIAWIFLGETLTPVQLLGIGLTIAGVSWVVAERSAGNAIESSQSDNDFSGAKRSTSHQPLLSTLNSRFLAGILFGLGGAIGQAVGLILSKIGLAGDYPVVSGNVIRLIAAAGSIWLVTLLRGEAVENFRRLRKEPIAIRDLLVGTIFGPVVGVLFSLLAVQKTEVGIASTIMALPPVFILPIAFLFFKEKIGWQAVAGTLLAVIGVAVLFLA